MTKWGVGPAAVEYNDEYYCNPGEQATAVSIEKVFDTRKEALDYKDKLTFQEVRNGHYVYDYIYDRYSGEELLPNKDMSDDEVRQLLNRASEVPELFAVIEIHGV